MYYYYYTLDVYDQLYGFRNDDGCSCIIILNHEWSFFFFLRNFSKKFRKFSFLHTYIHRAHLAKLKKGDCLLEKKIASPKYNYYITVIIIT
jgi:hypothetical protein